VTATALAAPTCLLCGSPAPELLAALTAPPPREKDYGVPPGDYHRAIYRCRVCGLYLNAHRFFTGDFYQGDYNSASWSRDLLGAFQRIRSLPLEASDNKQRVKRILAWFRRQGREPAGLRVLDVGSGLSVFLAELSQSGCYSECIDPDPAAVAHALEHAGVARGHAGTLDDYQPITPFDLVTFNKVLEHVPDPVRLLRQGAALLAPGGTVYVELPDGDLAREHGTVVDRQEFFAEHYAVYNQSTLARLAAAAAMVPRPIASIREPSGKCSVYGFLARTGDPGPQ